MHVRNQNICSRSVSKRTRCAVEIWICRTCGPKSLALDLGAVLDRVKEALRVLDLFLKKMFHETYHDRQAIDWQSHILEARCRTVHLDDVADSRIVLTTLLLSYLG